MAFEFDVRPSDVSLVEKVWHSQAKSDGTFTSTAESHWEMVVVKYEGKISLTIRGPETRASAAGSPLGAEFFGIVFKVGTYMPHLPIKKLLDRNDMSLPDAGATSFWLHGSAWEFPSFENADTFVNRLVREGLVQYDPVVRAALDGQQAALAPRALQYRFLHATGLTHSTIQQISRAKAAVALLRQGTPILDVVFETGYFDQPHLTRSLKRFMGQTPSQIARLSPLSEFAFLYKTRTALF